MEGSADRSHSGVLSPLRNAADKVHCKFNCPLFIKREIKQFLRGEPREYMRDKGCAAWRYAIVVVNCQHMFHDVCFPL